MLLGEPQRTPADIHFSLMGIRVRISPWFWVAALVLGWNITDGKGPYVLMWTLAIFISLMVHEFGHALAFRVCGISAHVVLYHFGGLAVPDSASSMYGMGRSLNSKQQIFVTAWGPGAQLSLAAIILALVRLSGHKITWPTFLFQGGFTLDYSLPFVPADLLWGNVTALPSEPLNDFLFYLLLPSIYWALLNLLPVYPLDGGQISRELFVLSNVRNGIQNSLILSIITGGVIAVFGLVGGQPMMGIMFGMLAYSSYRTLQQYTGRGGGFGGRSPW